MLIIKGYDTRYTSKRHAEEYARFKDNERRDACFYLNHLKTSCLGNYCKFWIEESGVKTNE